MRFMTEYKKNILVYLVAVIVLILIGFTALFIGSSYINPIDVVSYILSNNQISASTAIIISEIRLPRIILAFIVGAGLAVAGSVFQAIIRNPMVDPYIIGISAGAGTGVMVALNSSIFFLSSFLFARF